MTRVLITHAPAGGPRQPDGSLSMSSILRVVHDVRSALVERGHTVATATVTRDLGALRQAIKRHKTQVIFNLCEKINNDARLERAAVAVYEILGKPYTGNSDLALNLCLRKSLAKEFLRAHGIPTPEFVVVQPGEELPATAPLPAIVKPVHEDGSTGITRLSVVRAAEAMRRRVEFVHRKFRQAALVEEYIEGIELQVSLLGNRNPEVLAVSQLSYHGLPRTLPRICSYAAKWKPSTKYFAHTTPIVPAPISPALKARVETIALEIHRLFELRGYARVDFRVRHRKPYVIDVNPNPDLSADAGFARAAAHAGFSYPDIINRIVELAQEE